MTKAGLVKLCPQKVDTTVNACTFCVDGHRCAVRPSPLHRAGEMTMRRFLLVVGMLAGLNGCTTHLALRKDTVQTTDTLMDLQYQQVLDNVARFHANPDTTPSFAVASAGTVSVADTAGAGVSPTYSPTLTFSQQGGGALPILSLLFPLTASRAVTENWSLTPITDAG